MSAADGADGAPEALPAEGLAPDAVLAELEALARDDPDWRGRRTFSLAYHLDEAHEALLIEAARRFSSANGLNPLAFRSLKRIENALVAATARLLHGPPTATGLLTSGGTESCLLAVKTCRDRARRLRRVRRPEIILPETAHVAWLKGAEYFGLRVRRLPMRAPGRPDLGRLRRWIGRSTALVVASAPDYPHGMIDPVAEMGEICARHRVPLHVDACLGGFFLPFAEMEGLELAPWDFRVPGVTSISADLHKYGYAAKGASLLLWRDVSFMRDQVFVEVDWPGGVFASPGILGTRPGAAYAAAFAAMRRLGVAGYRKAVREALAAADRMRAAVGATAGLEVIGAPVGPVFAFRSTDPGLDIFAVGDRLEARGWQMDRVQRPDGLHVMVTAGHRAVAGQWAADLAAAVAEVRAAPGAGGGAAATYGLIAHAPLRGMVRAQVRELFLKLYEPGGGLDLSAPPPPARGLMGRLERLAARIARARAEAERRR